jgi:hypothetical protein
MHSGHNTLRQAASSMDSAQARALSSFAANPLLTRTPNLREGDEASFRRILRDYFLTTFDCYESLFECLTNDQAYYIKPITLRHPLIFYFGHTATFFVNKLLLTRMIS